MPLQDRQEYGPALTLHGEQLEVVGKFVYLGSCVSDGGGVIRYHSTGNESQIGLYQRDVSLIVKG